MTSRDRVCRSRRMRPHASMSTACTFICPARQGCIISGSCRRAVHSQSGHWLFHSHMQRRCAACDRDTAVMRTSAALSGKRAACRGSCSMCQACRRPQALANECHARLTRIVICRDTSSIVAKGRAGGMEGKCIIAGSAGLSYVEVCKWRSHHCSRTMAVYALKLYFRGNARAGHA